MGQEEVGGKNEWQELCRSKEEEKGTELTYVLGQHPKSPL